MSGVTLLNVMDTDSRAVALYADTCPMGGLRERQWLTHLGRHDKAVAAISELIEADKGYDTAKAKRIEAENRITSGDRSDEAFRQKASADHAYDRAMDRRCFALGRVQGDFA